MRYVQLITRLPLGSLAVAASLALAAAASAQTNTVGLSTTGAQRFGNDNAGGFSPQASDYFGFTMVAGDFNGDLVDDLATGMPFDNGPAASPVIDSGSVVVRYGTRVFGLARQAVYLRHRDAVETGDRLGQSLAACDLNRDGFDDLAVGIPFEDYLGKQDAGIVQVHFGSTTGLPIVADAFFAQSTAGIPDDVETADRFGWSLACADFDGDHFDDLAIGAPGENHHYDPLNPFCPPGGGGCKVIGRVTIVPGGPSAPALDYARSTVLDLDSPGMPNEVEDGDQFGHALAAGDFDNDGRGDLAVGTPGKDDDAGGVAIFFGGGSGLAGAYFLGENVLGGTRESDDVFGAALTTGDLDGDGFDDLVIGGPGEDATAGVPNSGQVGVLYGSAVDFDFGRAQLWTESSVFGAGASESGDSFGYGLAVGDFDRDGSADLAIGHPAEYVFGIHDGAATILMGSPAGITGQRRRSIAAAVQGMPGDPAQTGEQLGHALTSGDFDGDRHADLVVGSPAENEGGIADVGAETVLYGALFADGVESGSPNFWSEQLSWPHGNRILATAAAKLGPTSSRFGLQVDLVDPTMLQPATPTYVRVGPDAGFANERALFGTFFVDPQSLTMSPNPGVNVFSLLTLTDGVGSGSKTRLTFDLNRNDSVGGWAILATYFDESTNSMRFADGAGFALLNDPNGRNNRIDFEWLARLPVGIAPAGTGALTVWHTRYVNGVPDVAGRRMLFSVHLPGTGSAAINHAFAGMVSGQDKGTFGSFYLDDLSFRRASLPPF